MSSMELVPVPSNYICFKCKSVGRHWIQQCIDTNTDELKDAYCGIHALCHSEIQNIFLYCPFATLLRLNLCCLEFHAIIKSSHILAKQTILKYYQTTYIDSTIQQNNDNQNKDQNELDIDLNFKVNNQEIRPIFDPICFNQMKLFHSTALFQLYSRLISYNWKMHLILYNIDDQCIDELNEASYFTPPRRGPFIDYLMDSFDDIANGYNTASFHNLGLLNVHRNINRFKYRSLNTFENMLYKYHDNEMNQEQNVKNTLLINDLATFKQELADHFLMISGENVYSQVIKMQSSF